MENLLVSVIIPFYNEELFLKRAINSVLAQTYPALELIFIDDGSTDTSEEIVRKKCVNRSYKLLKSKNKGPGNARNLGIKSASGTYLVFLDADDELHPEAIKKMMNNLVLTTSDMAVCMFTMLDKNHKKIKVSEWNYPSIITNKEAISFLIDTKLIPTVWGKLFKTTIAKKCFFPEKFWKEDDVFMLQYLKKSKKISIVNESLFIINCRKNSLTRQVISLKMIEDICFSYQEQSKLLDNNALRKQLLISQLHTFVSLFLILKIDWNFVKEKKRLLSFFQDEITKFTVKIKKHPISYKKRVQLKLLNTPKIVGWKFSLLLLSSIKTPEIKKLKALKH